MIATVPPVTTPDWFADFFADPPRVHEPKPPRAPAPPEPLLGASEAAKLLSVCSRTLANWADKGLVTTFRTAGGNRRYRRADILGLIVEESAGPRIWRA